VKAFLCNNADFFELLYLDCFLSNPSSGHGALLHEINKQMIVLANKGRRRAGTSRGISLPVLSKGG